MVQPDMAQERSESVTSEHALLLLFMLVSGYMVVKATLAFPFDSAVFPQFVGAMTFVGSALLLVRSYLPEPLHTIVAGQTGFTADVQSEEMAAEKERERQEEQTVETPELDRPLSPALFTGILLTAYIGLSFLFSMVLMTPPFALAYLIWFKKPWYTTLIVTGIATVLAYGFATVLITPVDEGVFVEEFLYVALPGVL